MDEIWVKCEEFPGYSISSLGRVANTRLNRIIKPVVTKDGTAKVNLYKDGKQCTRSLKVLLGNEFVKGKTKVFNTIIHLDGDVSNNEISNLAWRPRWFALKYRWQMSELEYYKKTKVGAIIDVRSGLVYEGGIVHAGLTNGLLFSEILLSLGDQTPVFPTWQIFGTVK